MLLQGSAFCDKKRGEICKDLEEISAIISTEILDFIDSFAIINIIDNYALNLAADIK